MSNDAIVLLKQDHKEIRKVFRDFGAAGPNATATKADLVAKMIELLPDLEDDVLESYEEHHVADVLCMELFGMKADAELFDAKTTVLIENVTHHIEEEESEWFPKVREGLGRKQLAEIGERMAAARKDAPRTPAAPSALKKTIDAVIK
jgi:hypothetical protein